jgi:phosphodiester glycosidase
MIHALAVTMLLAAAGAWQRPAPGVETLSFEEGGSTVSLIRFDLQRFRPEVVMLGPEHTKTAAALRRDLSAVAAINGGFFDDDRRSLGLRIAGGKTAVKLRRGVDWGVLVVRPGRAAIVHSREFKPDARIEGAIQVGPRLIAAGQPLRLKPQSARARSRRAHAHARGQPGADRRRAPGGAAGRTRLPLRAAAGRRGLDPGLGRGRDLHPGRGRRLRRPRRARRPFSLRRGQRISIRGLPRSG